MAHDDLLIANAAAGSTILIANGGGGNLLIAPSTPEPAVTVGGPSGGKTKAKGYKLVSDELGNRPVKHITTLTKGKLRLHTETISKGMIQIQLRSLVSSIVKPFHIVGICTSYIEIHLRSESVSRLKKFVRNVGKAEMVERLSIIKQKLDKFNRAKRILRLYELSQESESMNMFTIPKKVLSFDFDEDAEQWKGVLTEQRFKAFTHSSSFIGNVRFDQDEQSMRMILNGKVYNFCNVPERVYDSFEGANSKGAFFNRIIKGQFDC